MSFLKNIKKRTNSRRFRVRNKLTRTSTLQYRAVVVKTNRYIYVSLVDTIKGFVVGGVSSRAVFENKSENLSCNSLAISLTVGKMFGELCKKFGVDRLVFDRGENLYHGKIASLATGIRETGINF